MNNLFKNNKQRIILNATQGIQRWQAPVVAGAIVRRIQRTGSVTLYKSEVAEINKIHEVLKTGNYFKNPFQSIASDLRNVTVTTKELGF